MNSFDAGAQAENYLGSRKILRLVEFLMGHLLVDQPDDPIGYLDNLLDKCILFRSGLAEPPLLFDTRHIESILNSLDPSGRARVSLECYKTGMETLGIESYNEKPDESIPGRVDRDTFVREAKGTLTRMLFQVVGQSNAQSSKNERRGLDERNGKGSIGDYHITCTTTTID